MDNLKGIKFKKSLGQNFIFDKNLLAAIVGDAGITATDTVLEAGAGAGTLTAELAKKAGRVIAVEIDRDLVPVLTANLTGFANVEIVFADILKLTHQKIAQITSGTFKVVANLPYYITTPIIFHFLEGALDIRNMTVMVQKEVAERIIACPGSKTYGALSMSVQSRADVYLTRAVKRSVFVPSPDVDSAVVRIDIKRPFDPLLSKVIRGLFAMRRKTVLNNLCGALNLSRDAAIAVLSAARVPPDSRAEQLTQNEVRAIAQEYKNFNAN
ncbi:MAG: 16S rRNA (adenine(1518)-N(6)/adenine(1519)-N(6))-dimethyltransferase RsmA [Firmicutes bacterium]|nr:16S rRNA (adenine(1518)-N(6)/adenine(1519)-N(6))-dimethyltransferase RsmA [Bacillota bacterium]